MEAITVIDYLSILWIPGIIGCHGWFEATTVRLLASVVILHFVLLAYSPPDYSPGNKLERRNHHLSLKVTSLQPWDLVSFFLIFNHLWAHLRQTGQIFPKFLWPGVSYRLRGCWGHMGMPASVILSFTALARRDCLQDLLPEQPPQ